MGASPDHHEAVRRSTMKAIRIVLLVVGFVLDAGTASALTGQLEVTNAWARATPGRSEVGAAYVTIQSPTTDRLVAASSPVAKKGCTR
jgi:copper(I)-binding protein